MGADELRGVLAAYKEVMEASWPTLHPTMAQRSVGWPAASESDLQAELDRYLKDSAAPGGRVRIFWKFSDKLRFGGCNLLFAQDAGLSGAADLIGIDDFDPKLPWVRQAPKYRADDEQVFKSGVPKLDIVERQDQSEGVHHWLRVGKTPIRTPDGTVIGILGMYEVLASDVGRRMYAERVMSPAARLDP
jgi:hypothetical protein